MRHIESHFFFSLLLVASTISIAYISGGHIPQIFFGVCFLIYASVHASSKYSAALWLQRTAIPVSSAILSVSMYKFYSNNPLFDTCQLEKFQNGTPFAAIVQIVSTLYAVSIAFLLVKGIQGHSECNKLVQSYINKIVVGLDSLALVEPEDSSELNNLSGGHFSEPAFKMRLNYILHLQLFRNYLASHPPAKPSAEFRDSMLRLRINASELRPDDKDPNDKIAIDRIFSCLSENNDLYNDLISSLKDKMSPILITFIAFTSAICIFLFFDLNYHLISPLTFSIGIMGFLFSFIFVLLVDMNDPYRGQWTIDYTGVDEAIAAEFGYAQSRGELYFSRLTAELLATQELDTDSQKLLERQAASELGKRV